jgi:hypothetical protein
MNRIVFAGLTGLACLLAGTTNAQALRIAIAPVPMRVAGAEAAYVGKVTAVAEKAVPANMYKGDMRQMKIATVRVSETLIGKGAREVKVGFFLPSGPAVGGRPGGIRPGFRINNGPQLAGGQEGVLMLNRHPSVKGVYVFSDLNGFVVKAGNPGYAKDLTDIKAVAKVLADPMKALKSKDAAERFQAAATLVTRYKTAPGTATKTEKVPAAESKLILEAIASADWAPKAGVMFQMNPQAIFARLALTPKDGFTAPRNYAEYPDAAKKWLKDNAGKYELNRYVRETGVSEEPGASPK